MPRQKFTREDIEQAIAEGVPQYGGEGSTERMIAFASRPLGEGNVTGQEAWFEDLEGGDALCDITFVERVRVYVGHGDSQVYDEVLVRDREKQDTIPKEVFEFVWGKIAHRLRGGTKHQPSA